MNTHPKLQLVIAALGFAAVTISISLFKSVLAAGPWYVAPGGNDSNSCLIPGETCATINGAISKASSGDTIYVATGTYTSSLGPQVVQINKSLTLSGGWDQAFTSQPGLATIDGEKLRRGVDIMPSISVTMERFQVQNGITPGDPNRGGIYNLGQLTLRRSTVIGNHGGIYSGHQSTMMIEKSTISNNIYGGIQISGGDLQITDCSITQNTTNGDGGGIHMSGGDLQITDCSITQNTGNGYGGGISIYSDYYNPSTFKLTNSTVSGNTASITGGGIHTAINTQTDIRNSTIADNSAYSVGGFYAPADTTIANTIISGNHAPFAPDCAGDFTSGGYNLIGDNTNCGFISGTGDLVGADPQLGVLVGIPGEPKYHPLLTSSPAIDAGDPAGCKDPYGAILGTDQRNAARSGRCDIGAYEYIAPGAAYTFYIFSGSPQHSAPGTSFSSPLRVAVLDILGSPVAGSTVTFTAPDNGSSGNFNDSGTNTTTAQSGNNGIASSAFFTANTIAGSYIVTATVSGISETALFQLHNEIWYVSPAGDDSQDCLHAISACASVNGVLAKPEFLSGDSIYLATGTYTSTYEEVVLLDQSAKVFGGWDNSFTVQTGTSILDAQGHRLGIKVMPDVSVYFEHLVVRGASEHGVESNGTLTLSDCMVIDNKSTSAGAGLMLKGDTSLTDCIIRGNVSKYGGGGIYNVNNGGILTIHQSTIEQNQAGSYGGGISNESTLIIKDTSISENSAEIGGGISNWYNLTSINSTISNNTAGTNGGGLDVEHSDYHPVTVNLYSTTVNGNQALAGGGLYESGGTVINLHNTLLAGNSADTAPDCSGNLVSGNYNLVGNTSGCSFTPAGNDLTNINAQTGRLIGFLNSPHYVPLLAGSPAINAGDPSGCKDHKGSNLPSDQRGAIRVGNCDIGAYEYTPAGPADSISLFSGNAQHTPPSEPFHDTLGVAILDSIGSPVANILVTFSAPPSGPSGTFADTGTNISTALSGVDGIAEAVVFTANSSTGDYNVTVIAGEVTTPTLFSLMNSFLYITPTGDDADDCLSPETPCATFAGVLQKATPNDIIHAAAGSYHNNPLLSTTAVVYLQEDVHIFGGWNSTFTVQDGFSILHGDDFHFGVEVDSGVTAMMDRFDIQGGSGQNTGGILNEGNFILSDSSINGNTAYDGGNGVYNTGSLTLTNILIQDNNTSFNGSGILNLGRLNLSNSTIISNEGYGIKNNSSGKMYLLNSIISDHQRSGIYNAGEMTVTHSTVSNNINSLEVGGGILNLGSLVVEESAIQNNSSDVGGGIYNGGILSMSNSTISGNQAHDIPNGFGGGIYNIGNGTFYINSSTISKNSADNGGGIYNYAGSFISMQNTLLAENTALIAGLDCWGTINSASYNLIGNTAGCSFAASIGDLLNIAPGLLPLNGSPGYHALVHGSPPVNAGNPAGCTDHLGNPLITDQRGKPRFGRCDIGAYELQPLEYSAKLADRQAAQRGETISYIITLDNPGLEEIADVQLTDDLPGFLNYVDGSLAASKGQATYQDGLIAWAGALSAQEQVSVTFSATVDQLAPLFQSITNTAEIHGGGETFLRNAIVRIDPYQVFCPLIRKPCPPPYADNFSNPSSGWPVGDVENYRTEYLGGEYRILVRPTEWWVGARPGIQAADYTATVDLRNPGGLVGYYGIVFGIAQDWSSFYSFVISSNRNYAILRYDSNDWVVLSQGYTSAIHQGSATNRIKVERDGASIKAYANGQLLISLTDSSYTGSRYIGLNVISSDLANVDIRFDNFTVYPLNCGELVSTLNTKIEWPASLDQRFFNIYSGEIGAFKPRR